MTPGCLAHLYQPVHKALELPCEEQDKAYGEDIDLIRKACILLQKEDEPHNVDADGVHRELLGPGRSIGPYFIEQDLRTGDMGIVFLDTRDDETRMKVALKVPKRGMDSRGLNRFHEERSILASLKHPHIAQLHDIGSTPGQLWYPNEPVLIICGGVDHCCICSQTSIQQTLLLGQAVTNKNNSRLRLYDRGV